MVLNKIKENKEQILKVAGILLVIFLFWLIFFPGVEDFLNMGPPDMKRIEVEDVKVVGYNKGNRTWKITARYVWAPRNTDRATLEYISDGEAYDAGRKVLIKLQARKVVANSNIEQLTAQEGVRAYLIRKGKKASDLKERILIWAEGMVYSGLDKKSQVKGSIRVQQKDAGVYADKAQIDHDQDLVIFEAPFKIIQKNIYLTADKLETFLDEERFILNGGAKIIRKKEKITTKDVDKRDILFRKEDLQINADKIDFISANDKAIADIEGRIVVVQPGKKAFGDEGHYDEQKDYVELRKAPEGAKQAGMILDKTDWLVDEATLKELKNPKTRETFSKQTTILADKIKMNIDKKDAYATGQVKVKQKGKLAYADKAYYKEDDENIRLKGSVRFQRKDGTWLDADEALVSLKDNTFKAVGEVETNIILEK
ncbi:LptA/OstA family protein [Candidatus Margulisiibacteriota bacterium]